MRNAKLVLTCSLLLAAGSVSAKELAELIIHNAKVTTQSGAVGEPTAVAVRGGHILDVGTDEKILALRDRKTRVIDAQGRRLIPGLNDSHMHPTREARYYAAELRWDGVPTLKQALDMVSKAAKVTPKGQWVRVIGGWSPNQFAEKRMPTPEELTKAAPDTPVFVLHLYTTGMYNKKGLDVAGITADTKAPEGSTIELDPSGKPTGRILATPRPTMLYQAVASLGELSPEEQASSTTHFYRELNRFGLTSVIDAGGGGHEYPKHYQTSFDLARNGGLPIRIAYHLFANKAGSELQDYQHWIAESHLEFNVDTHHDHGFVLEGAGENIVTSATDYENFRADKPALGPQWRKELTEATRLLVQNRWPIRIHATYGSTIESALSVFEAVDREEKAAGRPGFDGLRWAIDHAETIEPDQIKPIKALGGGIMVQNRMAYAGEEFIERYGKTAAGRAPPIGEIIAAGAPLGAGTDGTRVSSYNPWIALYWLVTGKSVGGTQLLSEENRVDRAKALELYTLGSAWFSGDERLKGKIAPGQYADMALLTADYFAVPEEQIPAIESALTITGGDIVYGSGPYAHLAPQLAPILPAWSPVRLFGGFHNPATSPEK